jgi:YHS domain-containing protein
MNRRIVFEVFVLAMTVNGCHREQSQSSQHGATAPSVSLATVKTPGEAAIGDNTTCTVHSDHQIVVTAATPKVEYHGKSYYFCCPVCANKFGERPQDYVK